MEKIIPGVRLKSGEVRKNEAARYMERAAKRSRRREEKRGVVHAPTANGTHWVDSNGCASDLGTLELKPIVHPPLTEEEKELIMTKMNEPTPPHLIEEHLRTGFRPRLVGTDFALWVLEKS